MSNPPTSAPAAADTLTTGQRRELDSLRKGTAALTDIANNTMRRRFARLLGRDSPPDEPATALRGFVAVLVGVAAIAWPDLSTTAMLILFAAYAAVDGVLALAVAIKNPTYRWRLIIQATVDFAAATFAIAGRDLSRTTLLSILAVWVVTMAAFRLRDAVEIDDHRIKVHWLLAALALVAITAGAAGIAAPNDHVVPILINVWIFPIINGVSLIARSHRRPVSEP
jgi:uncharacterized membrane protein HdeD (DUF308 family)